MSHTIQDIAYRTIDGETLLGRLYRPGTPAKVLVIEVHGGAWVLNDRLTNVLMHEHLAGQGIAVFAIDFRLAPKHRYPAAAQDINFAIRWLKANLSRLDLSPGHIGLLGTSSGGHLATLVALRPDDARFVQDEPAVTGQDARVDFLMACWPILDPLARYQMARTRGLQNLVDNHHAFWPDEAAMAEGNPHRNLAAGLATHLPPALIIQGTEDQNVEHQRTKAFAELYQSRGGAMRYHPFEGEPHAFVAARAGMPAAVEALRLMSDFVTDQASR
jgi:acetyl esterase/lipase